MAISYERKQKIVSIARRFRIVPLLEAAFFWQNWRETRDENAAFLKAHPDFSPLPLRWMHDMYRHTSFDLYWRTGQETAASLAQKIDGAVDVPDPYVADWGCGLARVLRHLPENYTKSGFDYNPAAVHWCANNIDGARFARNALNPPLPAESNSFDALYALSVFTHLSEQNHYDWLEEIRRVLKPGGVFLGAFHMHPKPGQLLPDELPRFEAGKLVVRGGVKEGSRVFTAHHPEQWLRQFVTNGFELIGGPEPFHGQTLLVARRL